MKNKIGYIIIGMLLGAIITTSIFLVYTKNNQTVEERPIRNEKMGEPLEMIESNNQKEPPEKPDDNRTEPQEKLNENIVSENRI